MSERPFNIARAVFWLVAAIVAVHLVVVLAGLGMCLVYSQEIVEGRYRCDPRGRLNDILARPFDFLKPLVGQDRTKEDR